MSNWIPNTTILHGETVDLLPLSILHFSELELLAKDKRIWAYYSSDCSDSEIFNSLFTAALVACDRGCEFPFVIYHKATQKLVGSTRFLDIQPKHKKLEIGWTWLQPEYWSSVVNLECKLLLLTFCFEQLNAVRVQIKTDENNTRSRKAIVKIGGHFEGIHRNDMIRDNNTRRNSAYYSIIEEEWNEKKHKLQELFELKK